MDDFFKWAFDSETPIWVGITVIALSLFTGAAMGILVIGLLALTESHLVITAPLAVAAFGVWLAYRKHLGGKK